MIYSRFFLEALNEKKLFEFWLLVSFYIGVLHLEKSKWFLILNIVLHSRQKTVEISESKWLISIS